MTASSLLLDAISKGIGDPGAFTARGDNFEEPLLSWEARGVLLALAEAGFAVIRDEPDHFITFDSDGWFVEHSVACRSAGTLGTCDYNAAAREIGEAFDPERVGRWRITFDDEGLPTLERADGEVPAPASDADGPAPTALVAGWGFPGNARKCHFFDEDEVRSVCGRWMFTGARTPENGQASRDDCAACRKVADGRR